MESQNIFEKDACQVQQVSVIRKIHNMQWLKKNPPSPGHIKLKTNKETIKHLKDDMKISELATESTISVPNICANDNLKIMNPINTASTTNDSKYNCSLESKTDEPSFLLRDSKCAWDINDKMMYSEVINDQTLILQELEEDEMVSMAIADSMITLQLEEQQRLKEQEEKKLDTDECNLLLSLEMKDNIIKMPQENSCDNNNNDYVNNISKSDLKPNTELKNDVKITKVQCEAIQNEVPSVDSNKEDQNNNINLNKEAGTSLRLNNSNKISVLNDNVSVITSSTTLNSNDESKKVQEDEAKTALERKEESKIIIEKDTVTSTFNRNNDVTLKQSTENKVKCEVKHSLNTSTGTIRKTLDRRDKPRQSMANTSKGLNSNWTSQVEKESMIANYSSEFTVGHDKKNFKGSEYGKSTFTNSVNKHLRVNRICHVYKKEEHGSVPKMHNSSLKPELFTIKEITNGSNSLNSMQSTNKPPFNTIEKYSTHKKILVTSNADNKYKNIQQNMTPLVSKECEKEFSIKGKLSADAVDKEVRENNKSGETKFPNEHSANNNVEQKQTKINPFLQSSSYLPVTNKTQTDAKNVRDTGYKDVPSKNTQPDNIPCTNIPYGYSASQHNTQHELIPSHQNFTYCTPDQFFMNCSVNNAFPKFYSNPNAMPLSQYGNVQTSNPSGAQLPNCSNPNAVPSSTGNISMAFQYQMPNVLSYSNQNIRPPPNFCVHHIMSPEEQFNLHTGGYGGYNPPYFVSPICACRNDCYPSYPQNWKIPTNQPVPLMQSPYHYNCNSFYNENVQSYNTMHKNTSGAARPVQSHAQVQSPYEQNLQRNYGRPQYAFGYDGRSLQNDRCSYNLKTQGNMTNNKKSTDFKKEKQDHEFSNENEVNNLPMVSPKACMFYGSKVSANASAVKSHIKNNDTSERLSTNANNASIIHGKTKFTPENQPNYKAQY